MKLKSYYEFILESILLTSDYFLNLIKSIDDPIAKKFSQLINKDIKTKYNFIDLTGKHDKLSFIPDSQITNKLKSGLNPNDLFSEKSNQTTIGRIVRSILTDNQIEYTDYEIEKFVNKFKSAYDANKIKTSKVESIRVVKGEDIRFWYLQDNYCQETLSGKGSLGKSCMRYPNCQKFLDIYVNNPEECSLVIYIDNDNKLRGRALLWKTNYGLYLDRIYFTLDSDTNLIEKWVNDNFKISKNNNDMKVKLTGKSNADGTYDYYPYMDSFIYYDTLDKTLYTGDYEIKNKKNTLELRNINGEGVLMDIVYCEYEDESYPSDQVIWSDYLNSYIHINNALYSNYHNSYIWYDTAVYSKKYNDYYDENVAVKVYLDQEEKNYDYYPDDDEDIFYDDISGKSFLIDLTEEDDDGNIGIKKNIWTVYQVEPESVEKYRKIYNILDDKEKYLAVEVDQKLFNIKLDLKNPKKMLYVIFIKEYYNYLLYKKIEKMIEDKDYDIRSIKDDQLTATDEILDKRGTIFNARNTIYKFGIHQFMSLWADAFDENFKSIFETVYQNRINSFKDLESSNPDFLVSLESISRELLEDPRRWHLGFWQNSSEIDQDIKNQISNEIIKTFKSEKYDSSTILTLILDFVKVVFDLIKYKCIWNNYKGVFWMDIFYIFLTNQKKFRDLINNNYLD
jgi:hypothetical protein